MKKGSLYLIPNLLGESKHQSVLPNEVVTILDSLEYFVVENERTARAFIKHVLPDKKQSDLKMEILDKQTDPLEIPGFLAPIERGYDVGVISEAGVPCVADPGADLVNIAHRRDIGVRPLVGPSSILLALMSSGFNGQQFAFRGYLPFDKTVRKKVLSFMEREIRQGVTQIFMETPYRNNKLIEELVKMLHPDTRLCIACDLTLNTEFIKTKSLSEWSKGWPDLHKRPAIFLID